MMLPDGGIKMEITLATCQFITSAVIDENYRRMERQIELASDRGAQVVHFCECCLSGYAGGDFSYTHAIDWQTLYQCSEALRGIAIKHGVYIVFGSTHRLERNKPFNCLYVLAPDGSLIERYDKLFCPGDADSKNGDLEYYTSGARLAMFEVKGVRFGLQICHDFRYPEVCRAYKRHGVDVMLYSYHVTAKDRATLDLLQKNMGEVTWANSTLTYPGITMPATMISYAANNYMWISAANSGAYESMWGSFVVRPDGVVASQLMRNGEGMLITRIDPAVPYYDSSSAWRERSMRGIFHSGIDAVPEPRIDDRSSF